MLRNFTQLAEASTSIITTDIPQAELPDLVDLAWRAKDRPVTSLQLVPPLIKPADPDFGVIADELERARDASVDAAGRTGPRRQPPAFSAHHAPTSQQPPIGRRARRLSPRSTCRRSVPTSDFGGITGKVLAEMNQSPPFTWPAVSVIMPVLDEERHLAEAAAGVLDQQYPVEFELVLALGPSQDRTDEIAAGLAAADSRVRLVENPSGRPPDALNAAIKAARHDLIVRVDGHGVLCPDYIRVAVQELGRTGAANVGGIMRAEGETDFEHAVARAMTSPLGIGAAPFHEGGHAGPADSVYLGVFRREVLDRLGGYDEHFARAQDWELNHRIRAAGKTVWFTPELVVTYRPRSSLRALSGQFFRTGHWRREVIRRHPATASVRYLAEPAVTASVGVGALAGLLAAVGGPRWLALGWFAPAGYAAGAVVAGVAEGSGLPWRARAWLPAVLATMHLSWGAGFIVGARRDVSRLASVAAPAEQN